jgi:hypothetical protein
MIPVEQWLDKYEPRATRAHYVQPDLEPYMAVSGDMRGKWITSRREHRAYLKRNNFVEVGTEKSYMTRNRGMSDDNPNLRSESQHEERICRSLSKQLEHLRNRSR